jgi:hypothetical protein
MLSRSHPGGGRLPSFDADSYRQRNGVERCFKPAQTVPQSSQPLRQTSRLLCAELTTAAIILLLRNDL